MGIKDLHFSSREGPQGITAIYVQTLNDTSAIFPWRQSPKRSLCDTADGWVFAASDTPWVSSEDLAFDPSLSSARAGSVPTASPILGKTRGVCTLARKQGSRGSALLNMFPAFSTITPPPVAVITTFFMSLIKRGYDPCLRSMPTTRITCY